MSEAPRAILYVRQSERQAGEDEKTSLSLRSQEERGRAWAAQQGATVVEVIADHDLRGSDPDRPGIRDLVSAVTRQRIDYVWFFSLSRLARDLILQLILCREIERAGKCRIVSDTEGGIDDPFIRGIHGLMHEQATRQISAHLRASFARRARDGGFPTGRTPMGYTRPHRITIQRANGTSYERQTGEPVIDPEQAAFVRSLYDRFDAGESLHSIANDLAAQGPGPRGGTWERSSVRALLSAPIYAGDIAHKGVVVAHNDAWAIVPREQWDRVQTKLSRLTIVRRGELDSWLEGLVLHSCGGRMYFQRYTGNGRGHGGMFVCRHYASATPCGQPRTIIGAALLESAVRSCLIADLGSLRPPEDVASIAQERAGGAAAVRSRAEIATRLRRAQERWQRYDRRFGEGKVSGERMDEEDALLAEAKRAHDHDLAALPAPLARDVIERNHARLTSIASVVQHASPDRLRVLLSEFGNVEVSADGVRILYPPDIRPHVAGETIPVPKGGKGMR